MYTLVATIHVIVSVVLILLVLVQDSKGGAGMFAGGSSQSILGATGGATLLSKLSRGAAVIFAFTCIMLTIYTTRQGASVVDGAALPPPAVVETPAATESAPAKDAGNTAPKDAQKPETKKQ